VRLASLRRRRSRRNQNSVMRWRMSGARLIAACFIVDPLRGESLAGVAFDSGTVVPSCSSLCRTHKWTATAVSKVPRPWSLRLLTHLPCVAPLQIPPEAGPQAEDLGT